MDQRSSDGGQVSAETPSPAKISPSVRYTLLAVAVIGLALVGYIGFVVYPNLDLSAGVGGGQPGRRSSPSRRGPKTARLKTYPGRDLSF